MTTNNQEQERANSIGERIDYLNFRIGNENYAIKLIESKEVIKPPTITMVPHTEDYVLGVINLRGQIIPVIDFKEKLNLSAGTEDLDEQQNKIIIVQFRKLMVGIMVDFVEDVIKIKKEDIEEITESESGINLKFIEGVIKQDNRLIVIVDIESVLFSESGLIKEDVS